jgi:hypothetical protein
MWGAWARRLSAVLRHGRGMILPPWDQEPRGDLAFARILPRPLMCPNWCGHTWHYCRFAGWSSAAPNLWWSSMLAPWRGTFRTQDAPGRGLETKVPGPSSATPAGPGPDTPSMRAPGRDAVTKRRWYTTDTVRRGTPARGAHASAWRTVRAHGWRASPHALRLVASGFRRT